MLFHYKLIIIRILCKGQTVTVYNYTQQVAIFWIFAKILTENLKSANFALPCRTNIVIRPDFGHLLLEYCINIILHITQNIIIKYYLLPI